MRLPPEEPLFGPWRPKAVAELARTLGASAEPSSGRPRIVAIDGRSASGKTTLARRLMSCVPGAFVVHTDDVAWWHSFFDWSDLLVDGILGPLLRGESVELRPPAWERRGRPGAITVPRHAPVVFVEGVGAARREAAALLDAAVWIQADLDEIDRRNAVRVQRGEDTPSFVRRWMADESRFLDEQRPWERATVVVAGSGQTPAGTADDLLVASSPVVPR